LSDKVESGSNPHSGRVMGFPVEAAKDAIQFNPYCSVKYVFHCDAIPV
jgi:hypothetical protein